MIAFKKKALLSLAAAGLVSTQVHAASVSGSMDLTVTMPEILVLYHFDEVDIDLSGAGTQEAVSEGDKVVTSTTTVSPITGALSIQGTTSAAGTTVGTSDTVRVDLSNAWAIRSISSGTVEVAGSIENNTLEHATEAGSEITVSNLSLTSGALTGASLDLDPQWALQSGDISFELDLSAASHAGDYAGAAAGSDTFLLTLTGN